jgi:glycosyltransferase involved in cell wall biosynthesis
MSEIAVLIPCYNEEKTIEKVVKDFKSALPKSKIYVYDNNSSDKTAELAKHAGAIVKYEPRQGKGNVIRSMFREIEADCYLLVDGDDTYSADDAVAPAKVISEFIKKNNLAEEEKLVVKGGIVEGKVVSADEVKAIASLPSREILIGKLLGSMQAPVSNTVGIMGNMVRSIVNVLDAIRKQKEEQASA